MSPYRKKLGFLALVAAMSLLCAAQTTPPSTGSPAPKTAAKHPAKGAKKQSAAKVAEPQPPAVQVAPTPPPPSRPYEMSPVAPQVTYTGGQLMISASNSTMADILNAVKSKLNTRIDFPPSAAQERVAVQLGPGNPRDVLAKLLQGSPFDYILLGSENDPTAVMQVTLTRRQPAATAVASGGSQNPAPSQPEPADEDADNEPQQPTHAQPLPGQSLPAQPAPTQTGSMPAPMSVPTPGQTVPGQPANLNGMPPVPEQNAPLPTPGSSVQPDNAVKTPEQLLQELQKMQREEQLRRAPRPPR